MPEVVNGYVPFRAGMLRSVEKQYFDLGAQPSPLCKKGRHDRCQAYDNMAIRCTCACHGKADRKRV